MSCQTGQCKPRVSPGNAAATHVAMALACGHRAPAIGPRLQVRWKGLWWQGTPEPIRWELRRRGLRNARKLPGCGCIMPAKNAWRRARLPVRRLWRRLTRP